MIEAYFLIIGMATTFGAIGITIGCALDWFTSPKRLEMRAEQLDRFGGWLYRRLLAQSDHVQRMQWAREESRQAKRRELEAAR